MAVGEWRSGSERTHPAEAPLQCSPQDEQGEGASFGLEWTTRDYVIAVGEEEGVPWILCGALAQITHGEDQVPEAALCTDWKLGRGLGGGWTCSPSTMEQARDADYFWRMADTLGGPVGAYVGAISRRVARVELQVEDEVVEAAIFEPPPELGLDFNFFVGFTSEPNHDVTVRVLNSQGDVLARERFVRLPELTVMKRGNGDGTVTGYSTEMLEAWERGLAPHKPTKKWIDCGTRCSVALEIGTAVTLVPEAGDGSTFAGWNDACAGAGPECEIFLTRDMEVIARFER